MSLISIAEFYEYNPDLPKVLQGSRVRQNFPSPENLVYWFELRVRVALNIWKMDVLKDKGHRGVWGSQIMLSLPERSH